MFDFASINIFLLDYILFFYVFTISLIIMESLPCQLFLHWQLLWLWLFAYDVSNFNVFGKRGKVESGHKRIKSSVMSLTTSLLENSKHRICLGVGLKTEIIVESCVLSSLIIQILQIRFAKLGSFNWNAFGVVAACQEVLILLCEFRQSCRQFPVELMKQKCQIIFHIVSDYWFLRSCNVPHHSTESQFKFEKLINLKIEFILIFYYLSLLTFF